ncbi:MucR family transcriptional regulator [Oricola indica]|uniref:MucR family transcriptional regulator n=1 Tax=Oricola indica TaxID=2872591 RepID=UPI003CCBB922
MTEETNKQDTMMDQVADIVSAFVSNNPVPASELPNLIASVHESLAKLHGQEVEKEPEYTPVVSVRASVKPDHLVCLECGAKQKTLKRHLMAAHGLTPEEYRARYNLKPDYPVTAPDYSAKRTKLAKKLGLGRKGR